MSHANELRKAMEIARIVTTDDRSPIVARSIALVLTELERQRNKIADLRGEVERMRRERDAERKDAALARDMADEIQAAGGEP